MDQRSPWSGPMVIGLLAVVFAAVSAVNVMMAVQWQLAWPGVIAGVSATAALTLAGQTARELRRQR